MPFYPFPLQILNSMHAFQMVQSHLVPSGIDHSWPNDEDMKKYRVIQSNQLIVGGLFGEKEPSLIPAVKESESCALIASLLLRVMMTRWARYS